MKPKTRQDDVYAMLEGRGFSRAGSGRYVRQANGQTQLVIVQYGMLNKQYTYNMAITFDGLPSMLNYGPLSLAKAGILEYCLYERVGFLKGSRDLWWQSSNWPEAVQARHKVETVCRLVLDKILEDWGDGVGLLECIQFGKKGRPVLRGAARRWSSGDDLASSLLLLAVARKHVALAQQLAPYALTTFIGSPAIYADCLTRLARQNGIYRRLKPTIAVFASAGSG